MSRLWVKICANTSVEDAQHAIRSGADAVGFVFAAESKRRVTPALVAEITPHLPGDAEKIGVFVEQGVDEIVEIVRLAGLSGVQLHAPDARLAIENATLLRDRLRGNVPRLRIVQVLHFSTENREMFKVMLARIAKNDVIDAVLIDSRVLGASGGTGIAFDWQAAQEAIRRADSRLRIVVAGGLTPANVRGAVLTFTPWGVDVASGVEASAGKKDQAKVESFIVNARGPEVDAGKTMEAAKA